MFLPDRYIKGECPKCGAKDQYGDNCEVCGAVYAPTELKNPYSALTGATPVLKTSEHYFFQLSRRRAASSSCSNGPQDRDRLQPEVLNKIREWFAADDARPCDAGATGTSAATRPTSASGSPSTEDKYFYVWLDAPVGYLASLKNYFGKQRRDFDAYMADPDGRADPLHRQGHQSTSTPCSGRRCCTSAAARRPTTSSCTASSPSAARR